MNTKLPYLVDSHEDLAWNMLTFGRDYTRPANQTRRLERGSTTPELNGDTLLGWEDYQRGRVPVVFATLFAAPARRSRAAWENQTYRDFQQAHRIYRSQLDAYHRLVETQPQKFNLLASKDALQQLLAHWEQAEQDLPFPEEGEEQADEPDEENRGHPVGLVVLMEGAEGVRSPQELYEWWDAGVRIIGPAWAGTRFCGGTAEPGPLTSEGFALLETMAQAGFVLDISHMDEAAVLQALDVYPGPIIASHANALSLLKGSASNRHLSERVIQGLLERDGIAGVVPFNRFLDPDWHTGDPRQQISLGHVVAQIDHICQLAGDAHHVGIGSDFDGGFGWQSVPHEIDTIADLHKLAALLLEKGYTQENVNAVLGENWLNFLKRALP